MPREFHLSFDFLHSSTPRHLQPGHWGSAGSSQRSLKLAPLPGSPCSCPWAMPVCGFAQNGASTPAPKPTRHEKTNCGFEMESAPRGETSQHPRPPSCRPRGRGGRGAGPAGRQPATCCDEASPCIRDLCRPWATLPRLPRRCGTPIRQPWLPPLPKLRPDGGLCAALW